MVNSGYLFFYFGKEEKIMSNTNQLQLAFNMIEEGVERVKNSDQFKQYLKVMSMFHDYSYCNSILIYSQCPHASYIAGYKAWKTLHNRFVKKGSRAIRIIAPLKVKVNKSDVGDNQDEKEEYILRYKSVPVFDVSQTEGEPLPSIVSEIQGYSENGQVLLDSFLELTKEQDIDVGFVNSKEDCVLYSGAKGYADPKNNKIVIKKDMSVNHQLKTMIHEYAHIVLHKESDSSKKQKEIEAESVAFVVCHAFGLDTSEYSFGYITTWSTNISNEELKNVLKNIQSKAEEIIDSIKPIYYKKMEEKKNEKRYY